MKHRLLMFLFCISATFSIHGQIGEISFISGEVELVRNEEVLTEGDMTIGDEIENYDQIRTGEDGQVIINLTASRNPDAEITIASADRAWACSADLASPTATKTKSTSSTRSACSTKA